MKMKYLKKALATSLAAAMLAGSVNGMTVFAEEAVPEQKQETGVEAMEEAEQEVVDETKEEVKGKTEQETVAAFVEEAETASVTDSGACGENATWSYADGVLTISGSGAVTWEAPSLSEPPYQWGWKPWYEYEQSITKLVINEGITEFKTNETASAYGGSVTFRNLKKLSEISLPNSLTELPNFSGCTSLKEIVIPDTITTIKWGRFSGCSSLEKVIAPNVNTINKDAFKDCSSLKEYIFADNVSIGADAFEGCTSLTNDNGLAIVKNTLVYIDEEKTGNSLVIPEGVTDFSFGAIRDHKIVSITIPSTLISEAKDGNELWGEKGDLAYELLGTKTLEKISVSEKNPRYASVDGCLLNKEKTKLLVCPDARKGSYIVPKGVETIGYAALSRCAYLTEVTIPKSVKNVEVLGCATANYAPLYFEGDAVSAIPSVYSDYDGGKYYEYYMDIFYDRSWNKYDENSDWDNVSDYLKEELERLSKQKVYYIEGTSGWEELKADYPRIQWLTWSGNQQDEPGTVPYYSLTEDGGTWDGTYYTKTDGTIAKDVFFFDGNNTYYLQADGTPMKDRLTYHPDGEHIIYLDKSGHEVFNSFQYCPSVGYTCYFDSNGYIYKDQITFVGDKTYYLNGNGKLENEGWFQFANGRDFGYANWDGTLTTGGFSYDPWGRVVFYHWNGMVARGLITDGQWYYLMDETDGHYLGSFPVN